MRYHKAKNSWFHYTLIWFVLVYTLPSSVFAYSQDMNRDIALQHAMDQGSSIQMGDNHNTMDAHTALCEINPFCHELASCASCNLLPANLWGNKTTASSLLKVSPAPSLTHSGYRRTPDRPPQQA